MHYRRPVRQGWWDWWSSRGIDWRKVYGFVVVTVLFVVVEICFVVILLSAMNHKCNDLGERDSRRRYARRLKRTLRHRGPVMAALVFGVISLVACLAVILNVLVCTPPNPISHPKAEKKSISHHLVYPVASMTQT